MIRKILSGILNLIYPPYCLLCQELLEGNDGVCDNCLSNIQYVFSKAHCVNCSYSLPNVEENIHRCHNCREYNYVFGRNYSVATYAGNLKELIHLFKYQGKFFLKDKLSLLMIDFFRKHMENNFDMLCCVPLTLKKERSRGYNQSKVLADLLSKAVGIEFFSDLLIKVKELPSQSSLKKKERSKRVKNAFTVKSNTKISDAKILLVDDVFTTGSTVNECARMLIKHGAAQVVVFTLARGVF